MAPKKPQLSARKGQLSHRDFKDATAKDSTAKGSESARSMTLSTKSAKPKKMKGLALAISQIPVRDDSEVDESLTTEELIEAQERADALEHQIEMQKSQFEQQMQQSALAMEELFDQLTAIRKERDVAVTALQRAIEERHADGDAELYSMGAITSPKGAMQEVRLQALKASYEKLQLDHAHSRLECRRLSAENRQLQTVVAAIKQLILAEPVAVAARRSPNAEMEDDVEETEETFAEDENLQNGAPTQQPTPATATATAAAAAPSTTEPKVGISPLDLDQAAATIQSHVRGRAAREQGRLLWISYGDRKDSIRSPLSELRAPRYSSELGAISEEMSQAGVVRDGEDDAEPLASLRISRGSIDPVAEAAEEDYWAEEDDDG